MVLNLRVKSHLFPPVGSLVRPSLNGVSQNSSLPIGVPIGDGHLGPESFRRCRLLAMAVLRSRLPIRIQDGMDARLVSCQSPQN